jgi:putative heme-binding domain-containing protein
MYQCLDLLNASVLNGALKAKDGRVRAAAMRVLAEWHPRLENSFTLLTKGIHDPHPRVRLEAMRSLSLIREARSVENILSALDSPMDEFLDYAAWLSINDLASVWVDSVRKGQWKAEGREKQLEFALQAIDPTKAGDVLAQVLNTRELPRNGSGPWIHLIGMAGDSKLLGRLFEQALTNGFDAATEIKVLNELGAASTGRGLKPAGDLIRLEHLTKSDDKKIRVGSLRLAGEWKLAQFAPQLLSLAGDPNSAPPLRQTAFDSLRQIGGAGVVTGLTNLVQQSTNQAIKREAVVALSAMQLDLAASLAIPLFLATADEKVAEQFWRSLLKTKDSAPAIAKALPKTGIPAPVGRAGLRVAREGGRNEPDLVWALMRGADLEQTDSALSATELQAMAAQAMSEGDARKGETIFRRKELSCVLCHAIGGAGGKVGPDLTSIGASAQPDYLVESILYPNRKIKEGYHSVIVETKDGLELAGTLAREDGEELVLRDATGKEVNVKKSNIEKRTTGGSLMPSGLVDSLSAADRLNLYRFLAELGKPGPFDASKGNVARVWKLYPQTLDLAQFGDERVLTSDFNAKPWVSALTQVDGTLLRADMDDSLEEARRRDPPALYAAARFQVSGTGATMLKFQGVSQAPAWVDGKPVMFSPEMKLNIGTGAHVILLKLDARKLPESLRVESRDATFLSAWPST